MHLFWLKPEMEQKILPTYIGLRLIQFIYAVIIKSPSGSGHKSHFEQLKETGD